MVFVSAQVGSSLGYGQSNALPAAANDGIVIPASGSSPGGQDTRARDINGKLTTNQVNSSQYWLNGGYTGVEPTMAVKAAYSDAQFAYDNAVAIAKSAVAANGIANVNPVIASLTTAPINQTALPTWDGVGQVLTVANDAYNWAVKNFLIIVLILAAVVFLPAIASGASRRLGRAIGGGYR